MNFFLLNIVLALVWAALSGEISRESLVGGFLVGYFLLWASRRALGGESYVTKVPLVLRFMLYFGWELVLANLRVAYEVITPGHYMRPGIVAIPLDIQKDIEIILLANIITLTPGTLSLDVSTDRRVLYVHSMYVSDTEAFRRGIKQGFERRIQELFK